MLGWCNYKINIWTRGFAIAFVFAIAVFKTQNRSLEKTLIFVMFSEFLTHPRVHHTQDEGQSPWGRMQAFFCTVLPIGHPITSFLAEHYQVMKAFDPGWAHHETSNPLLSPLKGVYHLQWLSLCLTQYFKSLDCTEGPVP